MTEMTDQLREIADAVDRRVDDICATLIEAARISSEVPSGNNYQAMVDHFQEPFVELGFQTRVETLPETIVDTKIRKFRPSIVGQTPTLLATDRPPNNPLAAFCCHLDTVPVGDRRDWSFDPLAPFVRDNYVWGRGTAD